MPAYRSENSSKWYCSFYYRDWTGKNVKKLKRGFKTKREALDWERHFLMQQAADLNMTFSDFWKLYERDQKPKLRESTWESKEYMVQKKILPYFGEKKMCEITARDVIQWQNEMRQAHTAKGEGYSETYLKSLHAQLSCIFNHAVRFYELKCNPARKAGAMGYGEAEEMLFWTKEEYLQFIPYVADKAQSYMAFELLYWCGIRMGDADGKISLNQQKPSKHAGLRRFGPEKFLQRNNEFMKERPIFYKKPIKTEKDFSTWLRCFYYTTKAVITEYTYF